MKAMIGGHRLLDRPSRIFQLHFGNARVGVLIFADDRQDSLIDPCGFFPDPTRVLKVASDSKVLAMAVQDNQRMYMVPVDWLFKYMLDNIAETNADKEYIRERWAVVVHAIRQVKGQVLV